MSSRRPSRTAFLRRAAALSLAAGFALSLNACIAGGTGTDTENGIVARVTDGGGTPLAGVTLTLFEPSYRPDREQARLDPVTNPPQARISDSQGEVRLELKAPGTFVVEGAAGGQTLFFDTLAVAELGKPAAFTFRARPSRSFMGKVRLASGMRVDSGRVFIQGTGRVAAVDAAGSYDLGALPEDAARMGLGVRFVSSPVAVLRAVSVASIQDSAARYTCRELPADSAAKTMDQPAASAQKDSSPLDPATVAKAVKSCDSLERGSVVNITETKSSGVTGSQSSNLLVLSGADTTGDKNADPVLVPLSCVPSAGKESVSYDLSVGAAASGGDIIVQDLAAECRSR